MMHALARDPAVVHLRNESAFYFEAGMRVAYLLQLNSELEQRTGELASKLAGHLQMGSKARWVEIQTYLGKSGISEKSCPLFLQRLTHGEECFLFQTQETERTLIPVFGGGTAAQLGNSRQGISSLKRHRVGL